MKLTTSIVVAAIALGVVTAACTTGQADRTGSSTITLKFAGIDGQDSLVGDAGPKAFLEALGQVSGGRIRAEVAHSYGNGETQAEVELIKAVTDPGSLGRR